MIKTTMFPGRYVQGFQALKRLGTELPRFGQRALMIVDPFVLDNLLLDDYFKAAVGKAQAGWRRVCGAAIAAGIPIPAMSAALAYYDGYRCERLPANLLQAQRDYFGAHTYERVDKPRGEFYHTNWTGRGGGTAASAYTV